MPTVPTFSFWEQVILLFTLFEAYWLLSSIRPYMKGNLQIRRTARNNIAVAWYFLVFSSLLVYVSRLNEVDLLERLTLLNIAALIGTIVMTPITVIILNSKRIRAFSKQVKLPTIVEFTITLVSNVGTALVAMYLIGIQWGPSIPIIWGAFFLIAYRERDETDGYSMFLYHLFHDLMLYITVFAALFISPLAAGGFVVLLIVDMKVIGHKFLP